MIRLTNDSGGPSLSVLDSQRGDNKRSGKRPKKLGKYLNFIFEAKSLEGGALLVAAVKVLESKRAGGTIF